MAGGISVTKRKMPLTEDRQPGIADSHASTTLVFVGDAQVVSEGFRLALDVMSANAGLLIRHSGSGTDKDRPGTPLVSPRGHLSQEDI
jgi:hypothetical protein